MLKGLDPERARLDPAYDKLSGSGQQGVDLWLGNRIAWKDVPDDARRFLVSHGEARRGFDPDGLEFVPGAASPLGPDVETETERAEIRRLVAQARQLVARVPDSDTIAEEFANLSRDIDEAKAIKRGKKPEVNVWSAGEQLNAIKYARESGFITAAEAQKLTRKLLRLPGKRVIADAAQSRRQARKGR